MNQDFPAPRSLNPPSPPSPPSPPNQSNDDSTASPKPQTPPDRTALPTHYTHDVKLHRNAVQLFTSTENHLYDTRRVEVEENAWQCKGTMNDASIQGLIEALRTRDTEPRSQTDNKRAGSSFQGRGWPLGDGGMRANS
ncbi:hypothetical protein ACJZ2D_010851 [Fusarium nematophilum]